MGPLFLSNPRILTQSTASKHGYTQFWSEKIPKKGQKNRKKGEKSCQEYQWYINYWPPCPGFGPKNGQKKTKTNLKTTYSKNHDGHINYLPTSFTKKKTFDTRDSRVVPHRS